MPIKPKPFAKLPKKVKLSLLKEFGATDEVIAMVKEIELKNKQLQEKAPTVAKAFGFGCGGVTC